MAGLHLLGEYAWKENERHFYGSPIRQWIGAPYTRKASAENGRNSSKSMIRDIWKQVWDQRHELHSSIRLGHADEVSVPCEFTYMFELTYQSEFEQLWLIRSSHPGS